MKPSRLAKKEPRTAEFGDFQTPPSLALRVCKLLRDLGVAPRSLLEPTCGTGALLRAGLATFESVVVAQGFEINETHIRAAEQAMRTYQGTARPSVSVGDFFAMDWPAVIGALPEPILALGNPPWVTNAALGVLGSANLPAKSNFQQHDGLDARTGKSNFDISEWMLIRLLGWLQGKNATIAMLCKTAVARKVLRHAWLQGMSIDRAELRLIDSQRFFGAAVDACLLICALGTKAVRAECRVYGALADAQPRRSFGLCNGQLLADVGGYERLRHLDGKSRYRWRSGVKHDCAKIMTLTREGGRFRNGLGEIVELERDYLFPMLRSSDVANGRKEPIRWMLVTQSHPGEDTAAIASRAPLTWQYLERHSRVLNRRASSIYRNRPRFSVFGVGPYSFSPFKVAISGLYKRLTFRLLCPCEGKPVVVDDTCYFLSCDSEEEAALLAELLNSDRVKSFYDSLIFWDAKRPITVELLGRLNVDAATEECGLADRLAQFHGTQPGRHPLFERA